MPLALTEPVVSPGAPGTVVELQPPAASAPADLGRRPALILLLLFIVFGTAVRFHGLDRQPFWFNEAASFYYAKGTLAEVVRHSFTNETNPPGFHLLIHFWMKVAGIHEGALRIPSAVAGSVTLGIMALLARRFLSRAGTVAAVALLALSPLHVWYSQECRAFALWVLCILSAYLFFYSWLQTGRRRFLLGNALLIWLAVSLHYFGFHAVLVENAFLLIARPPAVRGRWKEWLASQTLLAAALTPFAAMMMMVDRSNVAWWQEAGLRFQSVKSLVFHLNGTYYFLRPERLLKAALLGLNVAMIVPGLLLLRRRRTLLFVLLAVALPVAVNLTYSLFVSPILGNSQSVGRYFLLILPPYLILLGAGWQWLFERFRRTGLWTAALGAVLLLSLSGIRAARENAPFTRDDNRRLSALLFDGVRPDDLVVASPSITLDYYAHRLGRDVDSLHILSTSRGDREFSSRLPATARRVWGYFDPLHHFAPHIEMLQRRYGLRPVLTEHEKRLSGAGLVLLESDAGITGGAPR